MFVVQRLSGQLWVKDPYQEAVLGQLKHDLVYPKWAEEVTFSEGVRLCLIFTLYKRKCVFIFRTTLNGLEDSICMSLSVWLSSCVFTHRLKACCL